MSSQFKLIETKSENGKDYFIEGYVSTINPDFVNDIVDEQGQKSTYREIIGSDITMDEDHEEWRDPKTGKLYDGKKDKYPIARIVDAKLDSVGTWVRAKLNKYHPEFETRILPMIRDKYLHSFSIAYKVKKFFERIIDNVKYRVIQDLSIANIGITGNPINKSATFNMALKSFSKMTEENKVKELETQVAELKSEKETVESNLSKVESELSELKATDYKKMYEDLKAKYDKVMDQNKDKEDKKDTEMKSFNDKVSELESSIKELQKENAELKSFVESPQLKSIVEGKSKEPQNNAQEKISMWSVC